MNRETEFRGLRTDGKGWVYGSLVIGYIHHKTGFSITINGTIWYEVIPESVGQFTGLHDKNGVKIFEGDILTGKDYPFKIQGNRNYDAIVEWVFNGWQYVYISVGENRGLSDGINNVFEDDASWSEVIGNIHENK